MWLSLSLKILHYTIKRIRIMRLAIRGVEKIGCRRHAIPSTSRNWCQTMLLHHKLAIIGKWYHVRYRHGRIEISRIHLRIDISECLLLHHIEIVHIKLV